MKDSPKLDKLRNEVRKVDDQLLNLMKRRIDLAKQIGHEKYQIGLPVKNFLVEKEVIEKSRRKAHEIGLYPTLAEELAKLQIRYAVLAQEEHHQKSRTISQISEKKVSIIGGSGHMGRWFAQFFDSFNHQITIVDPGATRENTASHFKIENCLNDTINNSDYIILATPISVTAQLINQLVEIKPNAIIFDISSLKSPLIANIEKAASHGVNITSIHPMFGPSTDLLSEQNIILCEVAKNKHLTDQLADLFKGTNAHIIKLPIEQHDPLMAYVLGLSHLLNLAFAKTVSDSSYNFDQLSKVASSTFRSQLNVTLPVLNENQDLYFEIQKNNDFTSKVTKDFIEKLQEYLSSIEEGDRSKFKQYMRDGKNYFTKP